MAGLALMGVGWGLMVLAATAAALLLVRAQRLQAEVRALQARLRKAGRQAAAAAVAAAGGASPLAVMHSSPLKSPRRAAAAAGSSSPRGGAGEAQWGRGGTLDISGHSTNNPLRGAARL
jgi:hypothetical protein